MIEKRRFKRFQRELSVIFRYSDLNHFVQALTKNISLGGMCLSLNEDTNIVEGKILTLQFELVGHSQIVELKALVKWVSPPSKKGKVDVGVEFTQIDNPEMSSLKDKLQDLLNHL